MTYAHDLGRKGERSAALLLSNAGMRILEKNWRKGSFEIDIICNDKDTLVFVEVRTRKQGGLTPPEETLTPSKRQHIISAAQLYLTHIDIWDMPCRFDVVCIIAKKTMLELEHYRNVFELSEIMGSSNTYWQPW